MGMPDDPDSTSALAAAPTSPESEFGSEFEAEVALIGEVVASRSESFHNCRMPQCWTYRITSMMAGSRHYTLAASIQGDSLWVGIICGNCGNVGT